MYVIQFQTDQISTIEFDICGWTAITTNETTKTDLWEKKNENDFNEWAIWGGYEYNHRTYQIEFTVQVEYLHSGYPGGSSWTWDGRISGLLINGEPVSDMQEKKCRRLFTFNTSIANANAHEIEVPERQDLFHDVILKIIQEKGASQQQAAANIEAAAQPSGNAAAGGGAVLL